MTVETFAPADSRGAPASAARQDVLLFAEDPGGANILAPFPSLLAETNVRAGLYADARLDAYLGARGIDFTRFDGDADATLDACTPRLLVTGTSEQPDSSSLQFIEAARRRGVPSLAAIDMITNAERRFRGRTDRPLAHIADHLAVPDEATAAAYREIGVPGERITVCGHPHYDVVRARRAAFECADRGPLREAQLPGAGANVPVVAFLAEGIDRLNPAASRKAGDYTLHGDGSSDDRTTIVLQELLDGLAGIEPRPYTVLRLHPGNDPDDYAELRPRIDHISLGGDPLPLVWCADLVVGMTTMLLVEAYLLGKPTLSILPRDSERSWLPTTAAGLTPVATNRHEIETQLQALLSPDRPTASAAQDKLPAGASGNYAELIAKMLAAGPKVHTC